MALDLLVSSLATAILAAAPVLVAATGELFAETVGIFNLGIEGSMLAGALAGFVATYETNSLALGLLAAIAVGAVSSLLFGVAVVIFRAEIVVAGLALTFIAIGLTGVLGADYAGQVAPRTIPKWDIPLLSDIPYIGPALFQHMALVYFAFLFPLVAWFILYRTRHGLNMRTIGENPTAADVSGISVNGWRLFWVAVGGAFAGLGGGFLSLGIVGGWVSQITAGAGWIALAIVIFASWRPIMLILGAFLYGGLGTLGNVAQIQGWDVPSEFLSALPYVGTLLVLFALAWRRTRRGGRPPWPAALGLHFLRGSS
jgi:simple sugar transport system permease protein